MSAGRSSFGKNIIDTDQIFDGAITTGKLGTDVSAALSALEAAVEAADLSNMVLGQKEVTANGGAKQKVCTLVAGDLVSACIMYISQAWNGSGATVHVGHDGASQFEYFIPDASFSATSGTVIGNDPAQCGIGLYIVPGQTTTADDWTVTAVDPDTGAVTQTKTHGVYTVTAWPRRITTWVDPTFDADIYAYVTKGTGQTTYTGKALITLFGVRGGIP